MPCPNSMDSEAMDEWLKEAESLLDEYGHARWNTGCSETSFDKLGAHRHEVEADAAHAALLSHLRLRLPEGSEPPAAYQMLVDGKWVECTYFVACGFDGKLSPICRALYTHPIAQAGDATNAAAGVGTLDGAQP